jgi:peptide-methionine (S)-S-oxide reductase
MPRLAILALVGLVAAGAGRAEPPAPAAGTVVSPAAPGAHATATFAGGCFRCMQPAFDAVPGVVRTTVGYTGGTKTEPTYGEVSSGGTGHAESIEVTYDPARVSYDKLLDVFWHNVDPTVRDRQFCDVGRQYRTAIFYHDEAQRQAAEASKAALEAAHTLPGPIVTEIVPAGRFWPAEEYHQDYYRKNPIRYRFYRATCGRDARLREIWGAASGGH